MQISEMAANGSVDFAIATEALDLFSDLIMMPCYRWNRTVVVPEGHPLADVHPLTLEALAESLSIAAHETGYAGDDEPDVSALLWARLSFAPANAHDCAKTAADHATERRGGEGAVREICDAILALRSQA